MKDLIENLHKISPLHTAIKLSEGKYKCPPHIKLINHAVMGAIANKYNKIIVNMPPRHGKSEYISKYLPFWYLGQFPNNRVILSSYGSKLSEYYGNAVKKLIQNYGKEYFDIELDISNKSQSNFSINNSNGGMIAVGVGGSLTGKGANLLIIDDPIKNDAEANSLTYRESIWEWFRATAITRLEPNGIVIIAMTRWHHDDLTGRVLNLSKDIGNEWHQISLPIKDDEGIPLWKERYKNEDISKIRNIVGKYWFEALYMQRPISENNGLVKVQYFRYYEIENDIIIYNGQIINKNELQIYMVVDLAVSISNYSDFSVFMVFGVSRDNNIFIIDIIRSKIETTKHLQTIINIYNQYNPTMIGIESVQYQAALANEAQNHGLPITKLIPRKDKLSRLLPMIAKLENGKVFLRKNAHWVDEFIIELIEFPDGKHDDQADAFGYIDNFIQLGNSFLPTGSKATKKNYFSS